MRVTIEIDETQAKELTRSCGLRMVKLWYDVILDNPDHPDHQVAVDDYEHCGEFLGNIWDAIASNVRAQKMKQENPNLIIPEVVVLPTNPTPYEEN